MADKDKNGRFVAKSDATYVRPVIPDTRSNNYSPRKRRFYEKHESDEIFYDPYQGRVVRRGIPLEISSPEFDMLGIGRAMSMIRRPTIALTKRRDYNSKLSPRNYEYKKALEEGARHEAKTYAVESGIDNGNIGNMLFRKTESIPSNNGLSAKEIMKNGTLDFRDYLMQPETKERVWSIDKMFGSDILNNSRYVVDRVLRDVNLSEFTTFPSGIVPNIVGIRRDTPGALLPKLNVNTAINDVGHELKHGIDIVEGMSYGARNNYNLLTNAIPEQPRLRAISSQITNENKRRFFNEARKINNNYSDKDIIEAIRYYSNPSEISSWLHELNEFRLSKGLPGTPYYNNVDDMMEDLVQLPSYKNKTGVYSIRKLFNNDKSLLNTINKYLYGSIAAGLHSPKDNWDNREKKGKQTFLCRRKRIFQII